MFSLQVACILVTVFFRLRRAAQGFMNHHVVLRMQVDTLKELKILSKVECSI